MTYPIDTTREYKTRSGKRVVLHDFVPRNSPGNLVTFPVKGVIITSEKPLRTKYQIWTRDGRACVLANEHSEDMIDFPAVPEEVDENETV